MISSAGPVVPVASSRFTPDVPVDPHERQDFGQLVAKRLAKPEGTRSPLEGETRPQATHAAVTNFRSRNEPLSDIFRVVNQWEGLVTSVSSNGQDFEARLLELPRMIAPEEIATFSFDDVSESDHRLVVPGAVFYWFIGYHTSKHGQVTRQSLIRFRRLPTFTRGNVQRTQRRLKELSEIFSVRE